MADEPKGQGETFISKFEKKEKPDEELTLGEFINKHSLSSEEPGALKDMNNNQICERLGIDSQELISIQKELGHHLPEGAN